MENAPRKILDHYCDILFFVLGVVWVVAIFERVAMIQEQQYEGITGNQNNLTYVETVCENGVYGTSIISFLLGDDVVPVMYDGTTYTSPERAVLIDKIDMSSIYMVMRIYDENNDFPVMLEFEKVVEGEDGG